MKILLPSAGAGIRRNSNKPKIDVELVNTHKLYEHQIDLIKQYYPSGVITYILGFHSEKVEGPLQDLGCETIHNDKYKTTNIPYALSLTGELEEFLVIYGDIFFDKTLIEHLPKDPSGSFLIKDTKGNFNRKNVGVGNNGYLNFCFENKWSQITYFDKNACEYFNEEIKKPKNQRKFTFELINEMKDEGLHFDAFVGSGYCKEMDSIKDFNSINRWLLENNN